MLRYLSIGCFGALVTCAANAASFSGLGDLPGGGVFSVAHGVSANGRVTVGEAMGGSGTEAVRFTRNDGLSALGDLSGGQFLSNARSVSDDGETIIGLASSASGFEAFRWTTADGMVGLGDLAGGDFDSQGVRVSADGTTVVGHSVGVSGREAFRWTASEGMVGLGDLSGGLFASYAAGVSADGAVVVGFSTSVSGQEAFRWTASDGMVGLGDLPGGSFTSLANDVSADGSVVVGYGVSTLGAEAMRWTAEGGMVPLGDLDGGQFQSFANAVSSDGNVIVGQAATGNGFEAFVWTEADGMRNLRDLLQATGVSGLDNWSLTTALDISPDGKWVVGRGINPAGETEGYLANISPPAFSDVPPDYWAFSFIEILAASGITAGCGINVYCPENPVTRAQMAVFIVRGINGSDFRPPEATGAVFGDVPTNAFAASYIERFAEEGITSGCGGGNYCPDNLVTRAQMAVFLLRAKYGADYSPPVSTGVFTDVPPGSFAAEWIEALAAEGISAGCGNNNFCPDSPVTRAQMAVFLVRTFGL